MQAIGDAGFCAVALHMRGYGETTRPKDIEAYTIFHLVWNVWVVLVPWANLRRLWSAMIRAVR